MIADVVKKPTATHGKESSPVIRLRRPLLLLLALSALVLASSATALAAPSPGAFGIQRFTTAVEDESALPYSQAGGHPFAASTEFELLSGEEARGGFIVAGGDPKAVEVELPPGFVGNPVASARCRNADFVNEGSLPKCPVASAVGFVQVAFSATSPGSPRVTVEQPVYDLIPQQGTPAAFGFILTGSANFPVVLEASVRSDGDYGLTVGTGALPKPPSTLYTRLTFCENGVAGVGGPGPFACAPAATGSVPFLSLPTRCSSTAPATTLNVSSYLQPSAFARMTSFTGAASAPPVGQGEATSGATPVGSPGVPGGSYVTGCAALTQAWVGSGGPSFTLRPEDTHADTPSGYSVDLHVPQPGLGTDATLAAAHLDDTTVVLPEGVSLSPSAADGLQACTPQQIGLTTAVGQQPPSFDLEEPHCPAASKVGTVEVDTPLLDHPLSGSIYLAQQEVNPFTSKFAIYLGVDDDQSGVVLKLAGRVDPDPTTGQLTTTFSDNPQLPFEDFKLHFFGGARAPLANPVTCGTKTTTTALTPWSAADPEHPTAAETATPSDQFSIDAGAGGGACVDSPAQRSFALGFSAGTADPTAGQHSPFTLTLTRPDGAQEIDRIDAVLPPGLTASLAGVPYCPEGAIAQAASRSGAAEQASPSCPAASRIGTTTVAAGAGADPFHVSGGVYLAGPYAGAPLSLAFIVPAVAGPFDLGVQVVRAALFVNPETTQITAKSDPLPRILAGVPLRIREVRVNVDRPGFTLNPTSCNEMAVSGTAYGTSGASTPLSNRFQVGGCRDLAFNPQLKLSVIGKTNRNAKPRLKAVLTANAGAAVCKAPSRAAKRQSGKAKGLRGQAKHLKGAAARRAHRRARRHAHEAHRLSRKAKDCRATASRPEANISRAQVNLPHSEFLEQNHIKTVCTRVQFAEGNGNGSACPKGSIYGRAKAWSPLLEKPLEGNVYLRSNGGERKLPDLVAALNGQVNIALWGKVDSGPNKGIRNTFEVVPDAPVSRFVLEMNGGKKGLLVNSEDLCKAPKTKRQAIVRFTGQNGKVRHFKPLVANSCKKYKKHNTKHGK